MSALKAVLALPSGTWLLALGQSINLTAAVISVTVSALVGKQLAPDPALGTLPYGMQFGAMLLATYPASVVMRRYGRRTGFLLGASLLFLSGLTGYLSLESESFAGLVVAHALLGGFIAHANYYRFAATDGLENGQKPTAISLVISGGLLAAIVGPLVSVAASNVPGFSPFSLCYASLAVLAVATFSILAFWHPLEVRAAERANISGGSPSARRKLLIAIISAATGYFVMNLLMVQASLVMQNICSFAASSFAIQTHVLAMFAPSLFAGALVSKYGNKFLLVSGFTLLSLAALIGAAEQSYKAIYVGLLVLGLGWNLTYVGGSSLLSSHLTENKKHRWQGVNDTTVAGFAAMGAFLPSPLFQSIGWSNTNAICAAVCAALAAYCLWQIPSSSISIGATNAEEVPGK